MSESQPRDRMCVPTRTAFFRPRSHRAQTDGILRPPCPTAGQRIVWPSLVKKHMFYRATRNSSEWWGPYLQGRRRWNCSHLAVPSHPRSSRCSGRVFSGRHRTLHRKFRRTARHSDRRKSPKTQTDGACSFSPLKYALWLWNAKFKSIASFDKDTNTVFNNITYIMSWLKS